jgi:hypothetical protein
LQLEIQLLIGNNLIPFTDLTRTWTGAFDGLAEGTTHFVGSGLPFPAALTIEGTSCMFVILSHV